MLTGVSRPRRIASDIARTPFVELFKTFLAQFLSPGVGASADPRQRVIWTVAILLPPGLFLLIALLPEYEAAVLRAMSGRGPAGYVDDMLAWIVFLFTTYSMVTTGFVAVLAWQWLTFERRDWMVLGTLPVRRPSLVGAKLSALAVLFLVGALPISLLNATIFAFVTANHGTAGVLMTHFAAFLCVTVWASACAFALLVLVRAAIGLVAGPRLALLLAAPLQFLSVVALCSLVVFCPFVLDVSFVSATFTNWLPSGWFVGLFEVLRSSPRAFDPRFPFQVGALRAVLLTPIAVFGAVVLTIAQLHRQMGATVATRASPGVLDGALLGRRAARLFAGRDAQVRAFAEFAVITMARNGAHRGTLAIGGAIAAVIIIAGLANGTDDLTSLMRVRAAVLWMPLVTAYCTALAVRAALSVPSEPMAAWHFRLVPTMAWARVRGARAALAALVVPRMLAVAALLIPALGWRFAAAHAVYATLLTIGLIHVCTRDLDRLPFTHRQTGPEAMLKGRGVALALGLVVFAYLPVRLELALGPLEAVLWVGVPSGAAGLMLALRDRRRLSMTHPHDAVVDEQPLDTVTALNLARVTHGSLR